MKTLKSAYISSPSLRLETKACVNTFREARDEGLCDPFLSIEYPCCEYIYNACSYPVMLPSARIEQDLPLRVK